MPEIWDRLAAEAAGRATLVRSSRHAAAILVRGVVVSVGVNKEKTHPIMARHSSREGQVFLHAEMDALADYLGNHGQDLSGTEVFVLRLNKMKQRALSRPCEYCCLPALKSFGCPVVHYTTGLVSHPVATEYL